LAQKISKYSESQNLQDKIQFCLGRIEAVGLMICEGDEDCEQLIKYILADIRERLESGENVYSVIDKAEREAWYYIQRDYPYCEICKKAWKEAFRTIRYCLKRQFAQIV